MSFAALIYEDPEDLLGLFSYQVGFDAGDRERGVHLGEDSIQLQEVNIFRIDGNYIKLTVDNLADPGVYFTTSDEVILFDHTKSLIWQCSKMHTIWGFPHSTFPLLLVMKDPLQYSRSAYTIE